VIKVLGVRPHVACCLARDDDEGESKEGKELGEVSGSERKWWRE